VQRRNGGDAAKSLKTGDAYRASLRLNPDGSSPSDWQLGATYEYIEAGFSSLANPGLGSDRARLSAFGKTRIGDVDIDIGYREERRNLAEVPGKAREHWRWADVATTWQPAAAELPSLLRNPRIRLSTKLGRRQDGDPGPASAAVGADRYRGDLRLTSGFATPYGDWQLDFLAHHRPGVGDAAEAGGRAAMQLGLSASRFRIAGVPARTQLSWRRAPDRATGTGHDTWDTRVAVDRIDLGRGLVAGLDARLRQRIGTEGRAASQRIAGSLEWALQAPGSRDGGVRFALTGAWTGGDTDTLAIDDDDDLYLGLAIVAGGDPTRD
jgi:hypothetical protein